MKMGLSSLSSQSPPTEHNPPNEQWQARARLYIEHWEKMLWSDRGREIRRYLNGRGLKDDTLKRFHIGYNPSGFFEPVTIVGTAANIRF